MTRALSPICLLFTALLSVELLGNTVTTEANAAASAKARIRQNFDGDWRFSKQDHTDAQKATFDHSGWRQLDLPHDWSIEGPFDQKAPSGAPGGYLPCGTGWYRKTFRIPQGAADKMAFIQFDGVYKNSEVWINGHFLGKRPFGYLGFEYDLTPHLNPEGDNLVAVRVDNSLQPSSRWYTGSGIYRHVWLKFTDPLRVVQWGTQVTTPEVTADQATVTIKTTARNDHSTPKEVTVKQSILRNKTEIVATITGKLKLASGSEDSISQSCKLQHPKLWSPDSPNLYRLQTELFVGDLLVDRYETTFGVRSTTFDPDRGLILNGKSLIMKGMCNHDDLGPLGTALWDQALERRLIMLKEMGCNAIRTAHNPPPPELLDLCDQMGFLVINETFDKWRFGWASEDGKLVAAPKRKAVRFGYHLHFDEWLERDLRDHLMRDRNHPSVIMWSIANEVPEAQKYGELETVVRLRDLCHQIDPSRPVTAGCNQISGANESGFADQLDTVGYNGGGGSCFQYEADHLRYPDRFIYASEVPHSLQTRGEYRTHSRFREKKHQPENLTDTEVFPETHQKYESSYDNAGVRISARDSWRLTRDLPFVAGEFRWTGFDYIGESGGWPRVLGNFGIIDLANFPKDSYYFYQSQWSEEPMVHLLPHWTWPGKEGTTIPVWCYTNCDSVELFLNGKSVGTREFTKEHDMHMEWMLPYEAGELKAVATKDGKIIATSIRRTAGEPAKIKLSADRLVISKSKRDLSYVTIGIVDQHGTLVPKASSRVTIEIEGPARLQAVCNGDPMDHQGFQNHSISAFNGLARAIIAPTGEAGEIVLTLKSPGLPPETLRMRAENLGLRGTAAREATKRR